jgi:hypothetical protein
LIEEQKTQLTMYNGEMNNVLKEEQTLKEQIGALEIEKLEASEKIDIANKDLLNFQGYNRMDIDSARERYTSLNHVLNFNNESEVRSYV